MRVAHLCRPGRLAWEVRGPIPAACIHHRLFKLILQKSAQPDGKADLLLVSLQGRLAVGTSNTVSCKPLDCQLPRCALAPVMNQSNNTACLAATDATLQQHCTHPQHAQRGREVIPHAILERRRQPLLLLLAAPLSALLPLAPLRLLRAHLPRPLTQRLQ